MFDLNLFISECNVSIPYRGTLSRESIKELQFNIDMLTQFVDISYEEEFNSYNVYKLQKESTSLIVIEEGDIQNVENRIQHQKNVCQKYSMKYKILHTETKPNSLTIVSEILLGKENTIRCLVSDNSKRNTQEGLIPLKKTRKNILDLKRNDYEFGRFMMALRNLKDSEDWSRICGIHGNTFDLQDQDIKCPTDPLIVEKLAETGEPFYCKHSVYSFVIWHIAYVYQFELLVNKYNRSRDQSYITVPYLDIQDQTQNYNFLNEEYVLILFDDMPTTILNPLNSKGYYFDNKGNKKETQRNGFFIASNDKEKCQITTIITQFQNVLSAETLEQFSSNQIAHEVSDYQFPKFQPIENPHNSLHNIYGGKDGNMSDVSVSAYDPIFYLHHVNIDRYCYQWLYFATDRFKRDLLPSQILDETKEKTLAPFFKDDIFQTDPFTYKYGWQNNTLTFAKVKDFLNLYQMPYTYEQIFYTQPLLESRYVLIKNCPIPQVSLNCYVIQDEQIIGAASWFGINRKQRHCQRCKVTFLNLKMDTSQLEKQKNTYIMIEVMSKQGYDDFSIQDRLGQYGSIEIHA